VIYAKRLDNVAKPGDVELVNISGEPNIVTVQDVVAKGRTIEQLQTPCLLLDQSCMMRNVTRLRRRLEAFGVPLRPHLKTSKSVDVAKRIVDPLTGAATVSTLREAEEFGSAGIADLLYAVGITPNKLDRVAAIRAKGINLSVVVDSLEAAEAVAAKASATRDRIPTLIEVDSDGHRAGIRADEVQRLVEVGRVLHDGGADLRGVMTHAGRSYESRTAAEIEAFAEKERVAAVSSVSTLRHAGLPAPIASVGSTPTALFARNLHGVTEVRAGTFTFFDLFMTGLGVCTLDEIALSVLTTVVSHQRDKGWILVDAGWMALSRDRGTAKQPADQGYGLVCDALGRPYKDLLMIEANQEQGILAIRSGSAAALPDLQVGSLVRILPNHACATTSQHRQYNVIETDSDQVRAEWPIFRGW
jgi:D-serine deaminase-like pyridoxal phosphate-dependent protein